MRQISSHKLYWWFVEIKRICWQKWGEGGCFFTSLIWKIHYSELDIPNPSYLKFSDCGECRPDKRFCKYWIPVPFSPECEWRCRKRRWCGGGFRWDRKDCGGDGGISLAGAAGMTAGEHRRNRNRDDSASSSGTMRVKSDVYIAGQVLFPWWHTRVPPRAGAVSDNLFTPCHMFCQGNAFHQQGKQQWKTDHPLLKRRIIKTRKCRTFVSEKLPHTIMMNLSGASSRSAAHQFPMFMISPSFREGIRHLPSFFCSSS